MFNPIMLEHEEVLNERQPIIMLRNPIERAWSHFWFLYLKKPIEKTDQFVNETRMMEVCAKSVYKNYLHKFKRWNPILLSQEVVKKLDGFPVANKNFTTKRVMTKADSANIQRLMDNYGARCNKSVNNAWIK